MCSSASFVGSDDEVGLVTAKAPPLTERDWQLQVTDLASRLGWSWLHLRPGMTRDSWRTPISGPLGKGWPDLLLVRPRDCRLLAIELKRDGGKATPEQLLVLEILGASGMETGVYTPAQFDELLAVLR
jgi:hypothetical protein